MTGSIAKLIDHQQSGTIAGEDGQLYFFTDSALRDVRFGTLALGVRVTFEPAASPKGLRADQIRLQVEKRIDPKRPR